MIIYLALTCLLAIALSKHSCPASALSTKAQLMPLRYFTIAGFMGMPHGSASWAHRLAGQPSAWPINCERCSRFDSLIEDAPLNTRHLFGLDIWSASYADALSELADIARQGGACKIVVTPNTDHLVRLDQDPDLYSEYSAADYFFPDGMPVVWASRWLGAPLTERVTGADLFVDLCRRLAEGKHKVHVIGGLPGQENFLRSALEDRFPGLLVSVYSPPMGFQYAGVDGEKALERVNQERPNVLFVCLGMPKQERWCLYNRERIDAPLALCVGAALEFATGTKKRAPVWVRKVGMEWVWRLASDPRRLWRRYLVEDIKFVKITLRELRAKMKSVKPV